MNTDLLTNSDGEPFFKERGGNRTTFTGNSFNDVILRLKGNLLRESHWGGFFRSDRYKYTLPGEFFK